MYVEHNKPNWDKLQAISVLTSDSPKLGPALKKNPYTYIYIYKMTDRRKKIILVIHTMYTSLHVSCSVLNNSKWDHIDLSTSNSWGFHTDSKVTQNLSSMWSMCVSQKKQSMTMSTLLLTLSVTVWYSPNGVQDQSNIAGTQPVINMSFWMLQEHQLCSFQLFWRKTPSVYTV